MGIDPNKLLVTLSTFWTTQVTPKPETTMNNVSVPPDKKTGIYGVAFDPLFTFTPHLTELAAKAIDHL